MPIQIVSPVKIMKFNAEWWNNKDKRKKYRQTKDYKEKRKKYNYDNRDKIQERRSEKYICECGKSLTIGHKSSHKKVCKAIVKS